MSRMPCASQLRLPCITKSSISGQVTPPASTKQAGFLPSSRLRRRTLRQRRVQPVQQLDFPAFLEWRLRVGEPSPRVQRLLDKTAGRTFQPLAQRLGHQSFPTMSQALALGTQVSQENIAPDLQPLVALVARTWDQLANGYHQTTALADECHVPNQCSVQEILRSLQPLSYLPSSF